MEKLADDAAHEADRQKHRHDGKGGGQHGQADFGGAVHRGTKSAFAHLHMAHDVLAHHDGVVNQQPHAQTQRHQSDHVDGEAKQVHEQKSADDGDRQRQPGDHGGAPGIEKQKDDEHRQQSTFYQGAAHVVHADAYGPGVVGDRLQTHAGRQLRADFSQGLIEAVDHSDGVFVLGFLHVQQQSALAIAQGQGLDFLCTVAHAGYPVQGDGNAVATRDDDFSKIFWPLDAGIDLDDALLRQRADSAQGQVLVFSSYRIDNLLDADAHAGHGLRVQVDVDFSLGAAHQRDGAHAPHIFKPFFEYLVGPVGELHRLLVRRIGWRIGQHGHGPDSAAGRVKAQNPRLFDLCTQTRAQCCDFFAYVLGGLAAVHIQLKLNDNDRLAFIAARDQATDAGDGIDAFFNFLADFTFNDFRRCTRVLGGDHNHREVDVRKLVNFQALV